MLYKLSQFESVRFTFIALLGLAVDLAVATVLIEITDFPLYVVATVSFFVAAAFNYCCHELWTFNRQLEQKKLSPLRLVSYLLTMLATLLVRLIVIALYEMTDINAGNDLMVILIAAGVSFTTHYALSKWFIFRSSEEDADISANLSPEAWSLPDHTELNYQGKMHDYVLVIPVINEGERIREQLRNTCASMLPIDIVIADGGSTDGSLDPEFIQGLPIRTVLTKTGQGKLSAQLRMAYAWCLKEGYKGIVTIDGNGKDNIEAISEFIDKLEDGFDYVQGSRYLKGGKAENTPADRIIGNRFVHAPILSIAGKHWFTDTTNGYRGYSAKYLMDNRVAPFRDIFNHYELLFYLTIRAGQLNYRICEVPVRRSYPVGIATPTKINGLSGKLKLLKQTIVVAVGKYHPSKKAL